MLKKLWKNEKGFTLMEIVIVIVILGILALLAIPRLLGFTEQAELANDKEYAAVVARAAELYWASHDETAPAADLTDAAQELVVDGLVDAPATTLQFNEGNIDSATIGIAGGVATVTIVYTGAGTLTFSTDGGYTSLP